MLLMFPVSWSRRFNKQSYLAFGRPKPISAVAPDAAKRLLKRFPVHVKFGDNILTDKHHLPE